MSSANLLALLIFPGVMWVMLLYVAYSKDGTASKLRAAWTARTKEELVEGGRSWAMYAPVAFFAILGGVVALAQVEGQGMLGNILNSDHWERGIFQGAFLGLTLLGLMVVFRRHFSEAKKFTLLVMAGIESPFLIRTCVLAIVVFTEEFWRAVCLTSLTKERASGPQALVLTSAAYALAYLAWGVPIAVSEGILGAALGGLFLWSGSFFIPFVAHLMVGAQILLYAAAASPNSDPGDFHRRPFTRCPACKNILNSKQVNFNVNDAFFCPSCRTRITVSDNRRRFFRWGFIFVSTGILIASWEILPEALGGNWAQYWLSLAITFFTCIGLGSILQLAFPPKLECGDPDFLGLNIEDHQAKRPSGEEGINRHDDDPNL